MSAIDVDSLSRPVSEEDPAGPDLEYDAEFLRAFKAAEGTPDRRMGDTLVPGEEPDWRLVASAASQLLQRTKDLRIATLLARALLRLHGLPGLTEGLDLTRRLTAAYWSEIHPRLDPDDDNDPTIRVNVLLELCAPESMLHLVRTAQVARSRAFGPVSYRDLEVSEGRLSAGDDTQIQDAATLKGALLDCSAEDLQASQAALAEALASLAELSSTLAEHLRPDQMPSFDPLGDLLRAMSRWLGAHLTERLPPAAQDELAGAAAETEAAAPEAVPAQSPTRSVVPGAVASRQDVVRAIDRLCDYYARYEPSSPVPLLLRRAQRLAVADFMTIMRDMAPDALGHVELICGPSEDTSGSG